MSIHTLLLVLVVEHPEASAALFRLDSQFYLKMYNLPCIFFLSEDLLVHRSVDLVYCEGFDYHSSRLFTLR